MCIYSLCVFAKVVIHGQYPLYSIHKDVWIWVGESGHLGSRLNAAFWHANAVGPNGSHGPERLLTNSYMFYDSSNGISHSRSWTFRSRLYFWRDKSIHAILKKYSQTSCQFMLAQPTWINILFLPENMIFITLLRLCTAASWPSVNNRSVSWFEYYATDEGELGY